MRRHGIWSEQWVFYLTTALLLGAVVLRSILVYAGPALLQALAILSAWLLLFLIAERFLPGRSAFFWIYLALQTLLIFALLALPGSPDFYAALSFVLAMQAVPRIGLQTATICIALFLLLLTVPMARIFGVANGIAILLTYAAGNTFFAAYADAATRARSGRTQNVALAHELQEKNDQLELYAIKLERLAALRERQQLARDLHDSATQTVFSMTLTTQSALLLLERDPARMRAQLDRLNQLATSALAEIKMLVSRLDRGQPAEGGLAIALREHLSHPELENLAVSLEIQGDQPLSPAEEHGLYRIAQEALNNVVKHARTNQAWVRLCLQAPLWMEIEDRGSGFDAAQAQAPGRMGLTGMRERAREIGWHLEVLTGPGAGTRIRVEKRAA